MQEMIDICDFAVGLSRQLYGLTIATERPGHRMMETWHPLGVVGVITAFNFPVAVWAWNAALALVCGDAVVWKPSEKTPLTALAVQALFEPRGGAVSARRPRAWSPGADRRPRRRRGPGRPSEGAAGLGHRLDRAWAAPSARAWPPRFARACWNSAATTPPSSAPSADLDLALRAIAFAAMGTAGQRCTTLRRLIVHESVYDGFVPRLKAAYASVSVGNPLATRHPGRPADRHGRLRRPCRRR